MKRFSNPGNICNAARAAASPVPVAVGLRGTSRRGMARVTARVIAALGLALGVIAGAVGAPAGTAEAQGVQGTGAGDSGEAIREGARRRMESYQDRLRRGHERGQQRALDTNERLRMQREQQIQRLDDLRRQRSR